MKFDEWYCTQRAFEEASGHREKGFELAARAWNSAIGSAAGIISQTLNDVEDYGSNQYLIDRIQKRIDLLLAPANPYLPEPQSPNDAQTQED